MAGAGFKTFNTGDVLTASDVNTYLMQQTVMVFADSSARSTALGANVAEGMLSYLKDTNAVEVYNGSAWVSSDDPNAIQNTIVDAKGDIITATAADTPARLAVGADGYTLVADSSTSTGLAYASSAPANPVINGGFDIWQRGTSAAGANNTTTFIADRWNINRSVAGSTFSRQTTSDTTNLPNIQYAMRVQRDSGNNSTAQLTLDTSIETVNSIPYAGQTVTFSFWARRGANFSATGNSIEAQVRSGTGTDQNDLSGFTNAADVKTLNPVLTTTWQRFSGTGTVASNATQLAVKFSFIPTGTAGANDWYEVTGVQIDLGNTALPFRRSGGTIQGELAACQRYYVRWGGLNTFQNFGQGYADQTTTAIIQVPFPVTMRTVVSSIDFSTLNLSTGGTNTAVTNCTLLGNNQSNQMAAAYATVAAGLTTNRPYGLTTNNSLNGYIGFSAEL